MTVQTSYPGVYIQELPSLVHSVTPAPTSIAAFVGYTHPFRTLQTLTAIQLFSFADYQINFGGFFSSPWLPDYVGQAVYQFFLNGGPSCYVVGLPAKQYYKDGQPLAPPVTVTAAVATLTGGGAAGGSIHFTALQPVGVAAPAPATGTVGVAMQVTISNVQETTSANDTADIVISYGTTVETYRKVVLSNLVQMLSTSNLVTVALSGAPTEYPAAGSVPLAYVSAPDLGWTIISPGDFGPVFADYASLDQVPAFGLLATPGISDYTVTSDAVAFSERKRAFYIMDTPSPDTVKWGPSSNVNWDANDLLKAINAGTLSLSDAFPVSTNAALYYPWLATADPVTGLPSYAPPSGFVAGMCGQQDAAAGVWQSPAGIQTSLLGTTGVHPLGVMTDPQQGTFNQNALDCLRDFPGIGTVIFGARTTAGAEANSAQQQWRYVAVRRMALFIEQSLYSSLTWAVFQGNALPLWNALRQEVSAFMLTLFRQGAFAGAQPSDAFLVQCDSTTTTATDVANGTVNILVGFAPLVPAEFVVVQIAQLAGQAQS